jgi:hypothetical protein
LAVRAAAVVLIIVLIACLINYLRAGADFPIVRCLPFAGGHEPSLYDAGAFALLLMIPWGLGRLRRKDDEE